jgi:hypothetical protein
MKSLSIYKVVSVYIGLLFATILVLKRGFFRQAMELKIQRKNLGCA